MYIYAAGRLAAHAIFGLMSLRYSCLFRTLRGDIIQSPKRLYKAAKHYTEPPKDYTKT